MAANDDVVIPIDFKENTCYQEQNHNITYISGTKSEENTNKIELKPKEQNKVKTKNLQALSILEFFNESLKRHCPYIKTIIPEKEAKHFEQLIKTYSIEEIKEVITFAHSDHPFWTRLCLDPMGIKRHFNKCLAELKTPTQKGDSRVISGTQENNKKYAQQLVNVYKSEYYKIEVLNKKIEFSPTKGAGNAYEIDYSSAESAFKEQVDNQLRKLQFKKMG